MCVPHLCYDKDKMNDNNNETDLIYQCIIIFTNISTLSVKVQYYNYHDIVFILALNANYIFSSYQMNLMPNCYYIYANK